MVPAPAPPPSAGRRRGWLRGRLLRGTSRALVAVLLLQMFVVQVSVVRGRSMQPSLRDGDRLLVDRVGFALGDLERFDVVILRSPDDPRVDYVKRVVGLPGDLVALDGGVLRVNGVPCEQGFAPILDHDSLPARRVPPGYCFVLGDNRPISCDSREFGLVPLSALRGKVRVRFWPLGRVALL